MTDLFDTRPPVREPGGPTTAADAPQTSHDAARKAAAKAPTIRKMVEDKAILFGPMGFIDEQMYAQLPNQDQSSVRKRRSELVEANIIFETTRTRKNARGNDLTVWVHRDFYSGVVVDKAIKPASKAQAKRTRDVIAYLRSEGHHSAANLVEAKFH